MDAPETLVYILFLTPTVKCTFPWGLAAPHSRKAKTKPPAKRATLLQGNFVHLGISAQIQHP